MSGSRPRFQKQELRDAYTQLMSRETSSKEKQQAFQVLLKSNVEAAQLVALDYFCDVQALTRFGVENPYAVYSSMLLGVVRRQLQRAQKKFLQIKLEQYTLLMRALGFLGEQDDIPLIAPWITPPYPPQDSSLLEEALFALENCCSEDEIIPPELVELLLSLIQDETLPEEERAIALGVFRSGASLPESVEQLCLSLARQIPDTIVSLPGNAVWLLGKFTAGKHQPMINELINTWPEELARRMRFFLGEEAAE